MNGNVWRIQSMSWSMSIDADAWGTAFSVVLGSCGGGGVGGRGSITGVGGLATI